jgi:hypothetical protein
LGTNMVDVRGFEISSMWLRSRYIYLKMAWIEAW